jgi:hypothetical protein
MLRCEHVLYPDIWIERPRYIVILTRPDGREQRYGYDTLGPYALETAILNRIADLYELEFLDYPNWDPTIPVEIVHKIETPIAWKTDLNGVRAAIADKIKKQSKINSYAYYNHEQASPEEQ